LKSGRLFLSVIFAGALLAAGTTGLAQTASDSIGQSVIPFFDAPIDPDIYLIRPGERLEVIFINAKLPSLALTVDAESRIVHQKLGIFDLAGRTLSEARQLLLEPLTRLFNADQIDISIRNVYPVSIQVTGAVERPGRYVGYTSQKVSVIIDSAGGVLPNGSARNITFWSGTRTIPVDLDRARRLGDYSLNPNLYAGNRIHVPIASGRRVNIMGEVNDPRSIELLPEDNLARLVALAGGVRPAGDLLLAYVAGDSTRDIHVAGGIREGDFIVIPRSVTAVADNDFTVLGAVYKPGRYAWSRGTTLENLLHQAGGLTDRGNAERIVVFHRVRDEVSGTQLTERFPLLLGGSNSTSDLVLEPADSVVVAAFVGYVRVSGEVVNPGVYPFKSGETADHYLSLAGGVISGPGRMEIEFHDPLSNLSREGERRDPVYDGLEILVRQKEPGQ